MSDEKTMYLTQWKDQEKFPDFEPILIEILEKLEKQEQELQKTREQLIGVTEQLKKKDDGIERARLLMKDMQTAIYDFYEEEYQEKFNKWLETNKENRE